MRWSRLRQVCCGPALLTLLTGCSLLHQSADSALVYPGSGTFSAALPRIPAGVPESFGGIVLCVTDKPAVVTGVTPVGPTGGFAVTAWGLEPNPFQRGNHQGFGQAAGPLPVVYQRAGQAAIVTGHCPSPIDGPLTEVISELGVTVRKPGRATATASALLVHYRVGDEDGTVTIPYSIRLCDASDLTGVCKFQLHY